MCDQPIGVSAAVAAQTSDSAPTTTTAALRSTHTATSTTTTTAAEAAVTEPKTTIARICSRKLNTFNSMSFYQHSPSPSKFGTSTAATTQLLIALGWLIRAVKLILKVMISSWTHAMTVVLMIAARLSAILLLPFRRRDSHAQRQRRSVSHLDKWKFTELLLRRYADKWTFRRHTVSTKDGYSLCLFRIIPRNEHHRGNDSSSSNSNGKNWNKNEKRRVVIMQHGLLENSCVFLLLGEKSLAYRLCVEQGYEVWLSNAREWQGSHLPQFSIDELIVDDFPTVVDYVIQTSKPPSGKVAFMGVSQGAVQALGAMTVNGQPLERKISMLVLVSPAMYVKKPSWFGHGWFVRWIVAVPELFFGRGEFFFGLLGMCSAYVPQSLMPLFGWLIMNRMLGIMHQPMFHDYIPSSADMMAEDLTDEMDSDAADESDWSVREAELRMRSNTELSVNASEMREISPVSEVVDDELDGGDLMFQLEATKIHRHNEGAMMIQRSKVMGRYRGSSSELTKLHALCFQYLPGYPSTAARNVVHWFKLARNGSVMRPYRDDDERSYDYFQHLLSKMDANMGDDSQYFPPMQVLMGSIDPVIDRQRTRHVMQQLIQKHPDGRNRFILHEQPQFSHVCFTWGHQEIVGDVYDAIIDRLERHSDWS